MNPVQSTRTEWVCSSTARMPVFQPTRTGTCTNWEAGTAAPVKGVASAQKEDRPTEHKRESWSKSSKVHMHEMTERQDGSTQHLERTHATGLEAASAALPSPFRKKKENRGRTSGGASPQSTTANFVVSKVNVRPRSRQATQTFTHSRTVRPSDSAQALQRKGFTLLSL